MLKTLKQSFNLKFFFVFAVFAIFFFLVVGMPTPPGLLYKASESYLQSLPGYDDIKSGAINPALLEQNIDAYNAYLISVIVMIPLNLTIYYLLFVLLCVVTWNYLLHKKISVGGYWRSFLFNLVGFFIVIILILISYIVSTFIGSIGPQWWSSLTVLCFVVSIYLSLVLLALFNYHLQKRVSFIESYAQSFVLLWKHLGRILLGIALVFIVVFLASYTFYIPSFTFPLVTAIVALVQFAGIAWMHLYLHAIVDQKPSKK